MASAAGSLIPPGARSFGKYELVAKLATGGMAEIFLARHKDPAVVGEAEHYGVGDRAGLLVIKRVLPHLAEDARFVAMFRDEARLASRLEHKNVCKVFELGCVGDTYFISMEYLHGIPMSKLLLRSARMKKHLPLSLVTAMIQQSCEGLHHAHNLASLDGRPLDVVHRDVSPPNIFVIDEGYVKLLDFGVAKARGASQKTRTGTVKGKNSYMSPEQILGLEVDRRSDVFSLGIVMWESLTSSRLFSRETDFLTFRAITEADIPDVRERRPDCPQIVIDTMLKALAKDRDERYESAQAFADALTECMVDLGGIASVEDVAAHIKSQFSRDLARRERLFTSVRSSSEVPETDEAEITTGTSEIIEESETPPIQALHAAIPAALPDSVETEPIQVSEKKSPIKMIVGLATVAAIGLMAALFLGGDDDDNKNKPTVVINAHTPADASGSNQVDLPADAAGQIVLTPSVDASPTVPPPRKQPDAAAPLAQIPDAGSPVVLADAAVQKPRGFGFYSVDSTPWATIYIDGKKKGVTPLFKIKLPAGSHRVKAVSATGKKMSYRINIRAGVNTQKRLTW